MESFMIGVFDWWFILSRLWFSTWLALLTQSPPLLSSALYFRSHFTNKWNNFYAEMKKIKKMKFEFVPHKNTVAAWYQQWK